ncbi:MAG: galactokinase [Spirochaetaceae bacterium]|nr:galactokinase [Spirochaetaceae bacterium]
MKDIFAIHATEYETPPLSVASAPAVLKMLGEHTDFSQGLVMAASLSLDVRVAISFRKDSALRFHAADFNERKRSNLATLKYKKEDRWANHAKSVYDYFLKNFDLEPRGLNVTIQSNVPPALGLGVSAAINMATALALNTAFGLNLEHEQLAEHACRAQSQFFEKPVSFTNYLAMTAPAGRTVSILDLRSGKRRSAPFLPEPWMLLITDSKVPRVPVENELELRREDCRACLAVLDHEGKKTLRHFTLRDLDEIMGAVPERKRRRCIHIVEEIKRVAEAEEALNRQDYPAFARIIAKSHASLVNLYEISCPEIDWLVRRSGSIEGVLCSRLVGPGFGGSTMTILKREAMPAYRAQLEEYERIFGFRPVVHEVATGEGLRMLDH